MTDRRGGARVPDGVQRPASLPFARGPNRSDLSELPGTPGTPLPGSPAEPGTVPQGQAGQIRQALAGIEGPTGGGLSAATGSPGEPVTSGIGSGPGVGPEGLFPSPSQLTQKLTAEELRGIYPLLMRLATLPNATTETKILAQRVRANLPLSPEQMPPIEASDGPSRSTKAGI